MRTNPLEGDTDGDRLSDCLTPGDLCGGLTPDTAPLNPAGRRVDATPCIGGGCWPVSTPNLAAAMNLGGVNSNADPRDDVRSIWVAEGQYAAPLEGFQVPGNAGVFGGGINWAGSSDLLVRRTSVSSNSGPVGGFYVGQVAGVRIEESTSVSFDDSRIEDNTALVGGGVDVSGPNAVLRLRNSYVTGNTAQGNATVVGRGGGIHAHRSGRVLIVGSLIADNQTRVGPRWFNANEDGFGGGLFAHQGADVRMINATVSGNNGAGVIVVGAEVGAQGLVLGATAVAQNSIFAGNTMGWQATYTDTLPGLLGTQGRSASMTAIQTVARGVLGYNEDWNNGGLVSAYNECLGGGGAGAPFEDDNCQFVWFTGISSTSSTEVRTGGSPGAIQANGPSMTAEDSMVAATEQAGEFGNFCSGLEFHGRTEEPTTASNRGTVTCGTDTRSGLFQGLRGRGFQGRAVRPLAAPANIDELFNLPDYDLIPGTRAVDRGNQSVDWDPFTAGIQDAPDAAITGAPRLVGRRIDLGAFELQ